MLHCARRGCRNELCAWNCEAIQFLRALSNAVRALSDWGQKRSLTLAWSMSGVEGKGVRALEGLACPDEPMTWVS